MFYFDFIEVYYSKYTYCIEIWKLLKISKCLLFLSDKWYGVDVQCMCIYVELHNNKTCLFTWLYVYSWSIL